MKQKDKNLSRRRLLYCWFLVIWIRLELFVKQRRAYFFILALCIGLGLLIGSFFKSFGLLLGLFLGRRHLYGWFLMTRLGLKSFAKQWRVYLLILALWIGLGLLIGSLLKSFGLLLGLFLGLGAFTGRLSWIFGLSPLLLVSLFVWLGVPLQGLLYGLGLSLGFGLVGLLILMSAISILSSILSPILKLILLAIRIKRSITSVSKSKTQLDRWMHKFLSDEEKAAILIDYRIYWYGDKRPNRWTHCKVWLKTLHYLFYEVWFKEKLDKIKSFQVEMPRW